MIIRTTKNYLAVTGKKIVGKTNLSLMRKLTLGHTSTRKATLATYFAIPSNIPPASSFALRVGTRSMSDAGFSSEPTVLLLDADLTSKFDELAERLSWRQHAPDLESAAEGTKLYLRLASGVYQAAEQCNDRDREPVLLKCHVGGNEIAFALRYWIRTALSRDLSDTEVKPDSSTGIRAALRSANILICIDFSCQPCAEQLRKSCAPSNQVHRVLYADAFIGSSREIRVAIVLDRVPLIEESKRVEAKAESSTPSSLTSCAPLDQHEQNRSMKKPNDVSSDALSPSYGEDLSQAAKFSDEIDKSKQGKREVSSIQNYKSAPAPQGGRATGTLGENMSALHTGTVSESQPSSAVQGTSATEPEVVNAMHCGDTSSATSDKSHVIAVPSSQGNIPHQARDVPACNEPSALPTVSGGQKMTNDSHVSSDKGQSILNEYAAQTSGCAMTTSAEIHTNQTRETVMLARPVAIDTVSSSECRASHDAGFSLAGNKQPSMEHPQPCANLLDTFQQASMPGQSQSVMLSDGAVINAPLPQTERSAIAQSGVSCGLQQEKVATKVSPGCQTSQAIRGGNFAPPSTAALAAVHCCDANRLISSGSANIQTAVHTGVQNEASTDNFRAIHRAFSASTSVTETSALARDISVTRPAPSELNDQPILSMSASTENETLGKSAAGNVPSQETNHRLSQFVPILPAAQNAQKTDNPVNLSSPTLSESEALQTGSPTVLRPPPSASMPTTSASHFAGGQYFHSGPALQNSHLYAIPQAASVRNSATPVGKANISASKPPAGASKMPTHVKAAPVGAATTPAEIQVRPLAHPSLMMWVGREPTDPYEPFFIVQEDEKFQPRMQNSYLVSCHEEYSSKYRYDRIGGLSYTSFPAYFSEGPDLDSLSDREDDCYLYHPAKKVRSEGSYVSQVAEASGDLERDAVQVDYEYISAVKAVSAYNDELCNKRRRMQQWYVNDARLEDDTVVDKARQEDDESSDSD